MTQNELNDGFSGDSIAESTGTEPAAPQPKPLRKLKRIEPVSPAENEVRPIRRLRPLRPVSDAAQAEVQDTAPENTGAAEKIIGAEENAAGAESAEKTVKIPLVPEYSGAEDIQAPEETDDTQAEDDNDELEEIRRISGTGWVNALVKAGSVLVSLVLIFVLVLNMPVLRQNGSDKNVSLMYMIKHYQPLDKEGPLQENTMELNISSEMLDSFNDGLDLPQLIEGQYSVLLLGFDEDEFNTDVMWVLEFDIGHGKLNILQIPRDCCLPDYTTSPTGKINSVYTMGSFTNLTPIQRVVSAVEENFGIPIDAYVTTACFDIVDMVDLIGGIPIHLDNEIVYEADKIIPAGDIVLSGEQAEWFIRFRHDWLEGDIGRMQNQRRFMAAAMNKLQSIVNDEGRLKLYSYLKKIYDNEYLYTNLSLEDMSMVADFASTLSMDDVIVNMVPGEGALYYAPDENTYNVYSVHKQATLDMLNQYYRPYQKDMIKWDSSIQELITDYEYYGYDDTLETLDDLENATEPRRN